MRLVLPDQKVRKSFQSPEEVNAFLEREMRFWMALNEERGKSLFHPPAALLVDTSTTAVIREARKLAPESSQQVLEYLDEHGAIISDGLFGLTIKQANEKSPELYLGSVVLAIAALRSLKEVRPGDVGQQPVHVYMLLSTLAALASQIKDRSPSKAETEIVATLTDEIQRLRDETNELKLSLEDWQRDWPAPIGWSGFDLSA